MLIAIAALLVLSVLFYTLSVRPQDLPEQEPVSPFQHLDEAKARIYENLRDLQFEYRVGKLSDADYAATKLDLQKELARVLSDTDALKRELAGSGAVKPAAPAPAAAAPAEPEPAGFVCPHCGAKFKDAMKFCGACGQPMEADV